jgi:YD repeat-containing protein
MAEFHQQHQLNYDKNSNVISMALIAIAKDQIIGTEQRQKKILKNFKNLVTKILSVEASVRLAGS